MISDANQRAETLLVVAGALPGRLDHPNGLRQPHLTPTQFRTCKCAQSLMPPILRGLRRKLPEVELLVWNTCQRFECVAFWSQAVAAPEIDRVAAIIRRQLFPDCPPDRLAELCGGAAWSHVLRTAAGLNSTLPGESDVLEQLDAAARLAVRCGVAEESLRGVVDDVGRTIIMLRRQTGWQEFTTSHTHAAVAGLLKSAPRDFRSGPITVLGGSTTSAALIRTLIDDLGVPAEAITLLFRGNRRGGQVKRLRKALRGGHAMRAASYSDDSVVERIAQSAVVCFGIDHAQPVLTARALADRREPSALPLVVLDFNTFGSTSGLSRLSGVWLRESAALQAQVDTFAQALCVRQSFREARNNIEGAIARLVATGAAGVGSDSRTAVGDNATVSCSPGPVQP